MSRVHAIWGRRPKNCGSEAAVTDPMNPVAPAYDRGCPVRKLVMFRADGESGPTAAQPLRRLAQSGLSPDKEEEQDEARGNSVETEVQPERSQGRDGSQ